MRPWKRPVIAIAEATIAVVGFMFLADTDPDVFMLGALCIVVGVCVWFIADLTNASFDSTDLATRLTSAPIQVTDRRVMRLRTGLLYGRHDESSLERLRAGLVELVDDQLQAAHHVDRTEDPATARAVLGDELAAFVDDPRTAHALARPQHLDHILSLIEQI